MSGENRDDFPNGGNGIGQDLIDALLRNSLNATDANDLDSLGAISTEYSSLNQTMDELNSYLDRWEERHDRLREEIREALKEQNEEDDETMDEVGELSGQDQERKENIVDGATMGVGEASKDTKTENTETKVKEENISSNIESVDNDKNEESVKSL